MKIHQQGTKKFNKTCSLEVSIELLPIILIVSSKQLQSKRNYDNLLTGS